MSERMTLQQAYDLWFNNKFHHRKKIDQLYRSSLRGYLLLVTNGDVDAVEAFLVEHVDDDLGAQLPWWWTR